jgi:hypothetical protein
VNWLSGSYLCLIANGLALTSSNMWRTRPGRRFEIARVLDVSLPHLGRRARWRHTSTIEHTK